jgi:hypothetical protein
MKRLIPAIVFAIVLALAMSASIDTVKTRPIFERPWGISSSQIRVLDFGVGPVSELTALGTNSMLAYTSATSYGSIGIGLNAGLLQTTGDNDVWIGNLSGARCVSCANNTGVGTQALRFVVNNNNTAVGSFAGGVLGNGCTAGTICGSENVLVGTNTGGASTTGNYNTYVGVCCVADVTGTNNTFMGHLTGEEFNGGDSNTGIGTEAMRGGVHANQIVDGDFGVATNWKTNGNWTVASGKAQKTIDGTGALIPDLAATTPYIDFAPGASYQITYDVLDYTVGSVTVSFGGVNDVARSANGTYTFNVTPIAYTATEANTLKITPTNTARMSIDNVSFIGTSAVNFNYNTALGVGALYHVSTGTNNLAAGLGAARQHSTGSRGTYLGVASGAYNGTGDNNTMVGMNTGLTCNACASEVFLGYDAGLYETNSNRLIIDNQDRGSEANQLANALIYGVFGAGPSGQTLIINAEVRLGGVAFASLGIPNNGAMAYCSDCDPPANPPVACASAGAKTGAMASRINGAWVCHY